jgi:serpin B
LQARWLTQFDPIDTTAGEFKLNGDSFSYPSMMKVSGNFGVAQDRDYEVLEMPYEDESISMLVILPRENVDVQQVDKQMKTVDFVDIIQRLDYRDTLVQFPKFESDFKAKMKPVLEDMGMRTLFDYEQADLSEMTDEKGIAVTKVIHKAAIEVSEEGSEAAAASGISIGFRHALLSSRIEWISTFASAEPPWRLWSRGRSPWTGRSSSSFWTRA